MDLTEKLLQIGFTEYEARVYLALLKEQATTGYQLSKASGVPRSMVYEALKRLHNRGAALETVEGRSTLYRPVPPQMLLDRQQAAHEQLLAELRAGLQELYEATTDDRVWTVRGRDAALSYAAQLLNRAQEEAYLVLTDGDLEALNVEINAACHRDVDIHALLTGRGELACGRVAYHPPLESELQGLTDTLLVAVDGDEVIITSAGPQRETSATITRNKDLVLIARQFVWMELFTQRIYARLGDDLLDRLEPEDREIFASLTQQRGAQA